MTSRKERMEEEREREINKRVKDSSIVVWNVRASKAFVPEATALTPLEARRPLEEGEDEGGGDERPEASSLIGEDPIVGVLFCKDRAPDEDEDDEELDDDKEAACRDSSLMRSSAAILTLERFIFFQSSVWQ